MAEELKNLIEKIQKEGIEKAQAKAGEIEAAAKKQAQDIIEQAQKKAEELIERTNAENKKKQESVHAALKQAGRDLLLSLQKHIHSLLEQVISRQVGLVLKPEEMAALIVELIKKIPHEKTQETVVVSVSAQDASKLKDGLFDQLKGKIKEGVEIRPSEDIRKGFRISYDGGKSHFDFSQQELAQYITAYVKPSLQEILDTHNKGA